MNDELNCDADSPDDKSNGTCASCVPQRSARFTLEPNVPVETGSSISAVATVPYDAADNLAPLALIPFFESKRTEAETNTIARPRFFAASLLLLILVSAGAVYDHFRQSTLLTTSAHETESLASTVRTLKSRLDAIEIQHEQGAAIEIRKALDQMKTEFSTTHEVNANFAQLRARLDRIDNDHSARLDKLSERFDHDLTSRFGDILARLDKLERRPVTLIGSASAPSSTRPPIPQARGDITNPNETTGSIEKPIQLLRGSSVAGVGDGYAVITSRNGPRPVTVGDLIPGAGRVLRIERHGHEWAVLTSLGVISSEPSPY